jgi:hypothetical protein
VSAPAAQRTETELLEAVRSGSGEALDSGDGLGVVKEVQFSTAHDVAAGAA